MAGRGRPATYDEMKEYLHKNGELDWHKTFTFIKRTSVGHKIIRWRCNTKTIIRKINCAAPFGNYAFERLYATDKELFKYTLEHGK